MVYTLRFFFSSKCSLFHNSNVFGCCIIHILYTGCAKIKAIIPAPNGYFHVSLCYVFHPLLSRYQNILKYSISFHCFSSTLIRTMNGCFEIIISTFASIPSRLLQISIIEIKESVTTVKHYSNLMKLLKYRVFHNVLRDYKHL